MDIQKLSSIYQVRKLDENDIDIIYDVYKGNPMYFEYCHSSVAKEGIMEDLQALPMGKTYHDKYYIGFFDKDTLVAVMDLILHFPNVKTAYIGFFMLASAYQGQGVATDMITEIIDCLKEHEFSFTQLAYVKNNPQSRAFWLKNKFHETGVEKKLGDYDVVVMLRNNT